MKALIGAVVGLFLGAFILGSLGALYAFRDHNASHELGMSAGQMFVFGCLPGGFFGAIIGAAVGFARGKASC